LTSDPLADFQLYRKPHPNRLKEDQPALGADRHLPDRWPLAAAARESALKLKSEERRSANEHEEKFDDCHASDSDFGSQPYRKLCACHYRVQQ
jgi:hypothetical protein